jgi:hypothetical protein
MLKKVIFMLFVLPLIGAVSPPKVEITGPLSEKELQSVVSGNSMIGVTSHSHSLYELYFEPDGTLYFRKSSDNQQVYVGKWWITGNIIHSQWPSYDKNPTENTLQYYHLYDNVYIPFSINGGCGKANTFCTPFLVTKGKHSFVNDVVKTAK